MKNILIAAAAAVVLAGTASADLKIKDGETLAFLGDSITQQGQDLRNPDGYVNLILRGLANEGVNVKAVRAGISGHKSNDMLARLNKDVLSKKPNWMTFSCGVNDVWHHQWGKGVSLEDYKKNVTEIFDTCAASNCNVIVLTATPFTNKGGQDSRNEQLAPYNAWLCEEAARRGYPLADLNSCIWEVLKADPKAPITRDGVHMQRLGNQLMAKGVLSAMGVDEEAQKRIDREAWKDVWVICRFDLKSAENSPAYKAAVKEILEKVRSEPGCLMYSLMGDADTTWDAPQRCGDGVLWMIEHWDCINSLKAHLATPHMKAFGPVASPLRSGNTFHVLEDVLR